MFRVALGICTCDRVSLLRRTLGALERTDLGTLNPAEVVLIVIDNRPTGAVRSLCDDARGRLPMALHYVEETRRGIPYARNRAIQTALELGAELVAFIDDDDLPKPDWLYHLLRRQEQTGADVVFGTWQLPEVLEVPRWLAQVDFFAPMQIEKRNRYGLPSWAGTYNVLMTRRLLEALRRNGGVFRPEFTLSGGEDTDCFIRADQAGYSYATAPDSVVVRVWEPTRLTLRGLMHRGFMLGSSRFHVDSHNAGPGVVQRRRYRAPIKLAKTVLRLPYAIVRPSGAAQWLIDISVHAGELYASIGGRCAYYAEREAVSPATQP